MAQSDEKTVVTSVKPRAESAGSRQGALELAAGPGAPTTYPLGGNRPLLLGRDPAADVSVASNELSRRHCRLERVGQDWLVTDLGSVNGLHLNGVRIHSALLHEGDRLQMGEVLFVFRER